MCYARTQLVWPVWNPSSIGNNICNIVRIYMYVYIIYDNNIIINRKREERKTLTQVENMISTWI